MKLRVHRRIIEPALYAIVDWDYDPTTSPYYNLDMEIISDQKFLIVDAIVPVVESWSDSARTLLKNTLRYFLNKYQERNDKFWENAWECSERVVELDQDYRSFFLLLFETLFPDCQPGIQPNEEFVEDEKLPISYSRECVTHYD
ncbi:MAG: hypothetical protein ABJA67_00580 [Chthonomonadales bacterium]